MGSAQRIHSFLCYFFDTADLFNTAERTISGLQRLIRVLIDAEATVGRQLRIMNL
jgi:hypothetical protein